MAATLKKMFAALFLMAVALSGARVSAQTHHVVGGWGPDSDVSSWLSGRVFRVGDKIWFRTQESIVELKDLESLESCDLTNPIRMYTDSVNPVELENEGARYFTSADPDRCKNGLKLPVSVEPFPGSEPSPPLDPHPSYGPPPHVDPPHKYGPPPPHVEPPHMYGPPPPHVEPPHKYGPPPPPPYHPAFEPPPPPPEPKPAHVPPPPPPAEPKPAHVPPPPPPAEPKPAHVPPPPPPTEPKPARVPPPPPPPPPPPSGAAHLSGLSLVLLAGLLLCHIGM